MLSYGVLRYRARDALPLSAQHPAQHIMNVLTNILLRAFSAAVVSSVALLPAPYHVATLYVALSLKEIQIIRLSQKWRRLIFDHEIIGAIVAARCHLCHAFASSGRRVSLSPSCYNQAQPSFLLVAQ